MALCLSRKVGEAFTIGEAIVQIQECNGDKVRLMIDAPRHIKILRAELIPAADRPQMEFRYGRSSNVEAAPQVKKAG